MPLTGRAKRNYNRTSKYGPGWRQLYYDRDGMCEICGSVEDLEIHEEVIEESNIKLHLDCRNCHITVVHKESYGGRLTSLERKYSSMLAKDISDEIIDAGGLENWKKLYGIKEKVVSTKTY